MAYKQQFESKKAMKSFTGMKPKYVPKSKYVKEEVHAGKEKVSGAKEALLSRVSTPMSVQGAIMHHAKLMAKVAAVGKLSAGWFSVGKDTKLEDPAIALSAELKDFTAFARGAIGQNLGLKPIAMVLPVTTTFAATVTTGIVNSILNVAVSDSPEWTSIQALFDEYKFHKGVFRYDVIAPTNTIVLGTSSIGTSAACGIGYDPADNTAATDIRDILQLSQHKQLFPRIIATPTVGTYVGVFGRNDCEPNVFKFKVEDVAIVTNSGGTGAVGMWKSTQLASFTDGYLKPYYLSGHSTAVNAIIGTLYYHVSLRSRT